MLSSQETVIESPIERNVGGKAGRGPLVRTQGRKTRHSRLFQNSRVLGASFGGCVSIGGVNNVLDEVHINEPT